MTPARKRSAGPARVDPTDLVGPAEIAERLGVGAGAVRMWRVRGLMPDPVDVVSRVPIWEWPKILEWAVITGRDSRSNCARRFNNELLQFRRGRGVTVAGTPERSNLVSQLHDVVRTARNDGFGREEVVRMLRETW